MRLNAVKLLALGLAIFTLVACGGSSSNEPSAATIASVNAGADISVLEGQNFTLTATVYPEGGSVFWTQIAGPTLADIPVDASLSIAAATPTVNVDTTVTFQAEYVALDGQVVSDTVNVYVENVNDAPVALISIDEETDPPFATYEVITLNGTESYDPDGTIVSYQWSQVDDFAPVEFVTELTLDTVEFVAPFVTEITNYKFKLTVTDNFGLSRSNSIDVQIAATQDTIAANAVAVPTVDEFTTVTLDGSESASSVSEVTCNWTLTSGLDITIANSGECVTTFVAPNVDTQEVLVLTLDVEDTDGNMASDSVSITVNPLNLGQLHDTGVTVCYDNDQQIDCGNAEFPEQDADTGRDPLSDVIDKSGEGEQAFDFTKFDQFGDEVGNGALVFSCIRDNHTGLIWEVKQSIPATQFTSLRGADNYYSFDDSAVAGSSCPSDSDCGVESFLSEVNEQTYCGGDNWRLPSFLELLGIMNYGDLDLEQLLPEEFFPNTPNSVALGHKFYWVAESSAEGEAERFHWVIDLENGDDSAILNSCEDIADVSTCSAYVIMVRTP